MCVVYIFLNITHIQYRNKSYINIQTSTKIQIPVVKSIHSNFVAFISGMIWKGFYHRLIQLCLLIGVYCVRLHATVGVNEFY